MCDLFFPSSPCLRHACNFEFINVKCIPGLESVPAFASGLNKCYTV